MTAIDSQSSRRSPRKCLLLAVGCFTLIIAGCATGPSAKDSGPRFTFYPPAPEAPRLQFLVSFSEEKDLGPSVSKLAEFVTGAVPPSEPILKPYGVVLFSNQVFVCDTGARSLDILDLVERSMRRFTPADSAKLGMPVNLAVDVDGTRYVADTGRNQVLIYGPDESFRGAFREDGSFRPTGVALTAARVYIADINGHCVRVYEKTGRRLLFTIPREPEEEEEREPGKLFMPVNLTLDQSGRLYVSDMAACRIQIYDSEGKHLRSLGSRGDLPGQFARPKGVVVDRANRVYVVDAASQVCQIFNAEGKLLLGFGEPGGSAASLSLPAAVIVDYEHVGLFEKYAAPDFVVEHLVIITNQYGPRKISVYGLGHKK